MPARDRVVVPLSAAGAGTLAEGARIVEPGPERYGECLAVLRAGFGTQLTEYGITPENNPHYPSFWEADAIARVVARPTVLLAVEDVGRLVGCCFAGPSRRDPASWTLRHLGVAPAARHRGFGELLVTEAAARAAAAGAGVLRIGIIAENLRLAAWYHRLGFVTVDAGNRYGTLPFTVDHLELRLSPAPAASGRDQG